MNFYQIKDVIESNFAGIMQCQENKDGRINSIKDEAAIANYLKQCFPDNFVEEKPRFWYDAALQFKDNFFPINIKSTTGKAADNISSKEGMYYALTERNPIEDKINSFEKFNQKVVSYYKEETNTDYYFLVYLKEENKLIFTSLKRLSILVPNGNNLPFQCRWNGDNLRETSRSAKEQNKYIFSTYITSFMKRTPGLDVLLQWRDENG